MLMKLVPTCSLYHGESPDTSYAYPQALDPSAVPRRNQVLAGSKHTCCCSRVPSTLHTTQAQTLGSKLPPPSSNTPAPSPTLPPASFHLHLVFLCVHVCVSHLLLTVPDSHPRSSSPSLIQTPTRRNRPSRQSPAPFPHDPWLPRWLLSLQ